MTSTSLLGALVLFATAIVACGGTSLATTGGDGGGGGDGGSHPGPPPSTLPPPTEHRPSAAACPAARPAGLDTDGGVPDSGIPYGNCARDSDCTQGKNGRCSPPLHNGVGNYCTYDDCSTDDDCGAGKMCDCGASTGRNGSDGTPMRTGNRCLPAGCRIDADCGAGGFCSPTFDTSCGPYNGTVGYECHTPNDACTNHDQCTSSGGGSGYCAWEPASGKWTCGHSICAG